MKLPGPAVAALAHEAGWPRDQLVTAVAVAHAESKWDPAARGDEELADEKWGPSVGLWQIRSLHADRGTGRLRDEDANIDPARNARHAVRIWRQSGWRPWSVWTSGRYRASIPTARAAVDEYLNDPSGAAQLVDLYRPDGLHTPGGGATDVSGGLFAQLVAGRTWVRVAQVVGGGVLAGVGMVILARGQVPAAIKGMVTNG